MRRGIRVDRLRWTAVVVAGVLLLLLGVAAVPARAADDPVTELAQKYAPIVVVRDQQEPCGDGEPYRPTPVTVVLGNPDVVLRGPDGQQIGAPTAADLAGKGGDWYLDYPGNPLDPGCSYEEWFRAATTETQPTLYARLATDAAHPDKIALQYWFFYTFNDWNDKHEGDWEMIQIVLPASTAEQALTVIPESVAFAQHEGSQVSPWEGGSLIKVGERPVVYPGQGSHAAYYTQDVWFGKSAAAGFGCDNTTAPGLQVDPRIEVIPDGPPPTDGPFAWASYQGHWGQEEASFNNGPTGPVTKTQWSSPITWQEEEGRTSAVALPPAPGPAVTAFCGLTAGGSLLFVDLMNSPMLVIGALLLIAVLAVVLIRRTRWRGGDAEHPDRRRRAGQIITASFGWVRRHFVAVLGIAVVVAVVAVGSSLIRNALLAPRLTGDITDVYGQTSRWAAQAALMVVALIVAVLIGWVAASIIALVRDDASGRRPNARRALAAGWSEPSAIITAVLLLIAAAMLTGVLILIPFAALLVSIWAVAPAAAVVEGASVGPAWRRSSGLTKGRRWRTLAVQSMLLFIGLVLPGLVGAILLLATSWPFWVVGLTSAALLALLVPVAFAGTAMQYYDLRARQGG